MDNYVSKRGGGHLPTQLLYNRVVISMLAEKLKEIKSKVGSNW